MTIDSADERPSMIGNLVLWLAQIALSGPFIFGGVVKLTTPIAELAKVMVWTAEYPMLARFTALVDILGGLGVLLPALTRVRPQVTIQAAWGCAALQLCAMAFHLSRSEAAMVPMNIAFLALAIFIAWGRTKWLPITPRV